MKKIILMIITVFMVLGCVSASANHIPVLLYHDVQQQYTPDRAVITVTPEVLDEHIGTLLSNGYTPISYDDICKAAKGDFAMPEKPVIITFDDGYLTNYTHAFPIIQKHKVKATIFVITETVGKTTGNPHFTWEQAKAMQRSGLVSIQSHTNTHMDLLTMNNYEIERELRLSKYLVEKNLGTECDYLAFPFGSCNSQIVNSAYNAGYKVVSQVGETGTNTLEDIYKNPIVRITVYGSWSGDDLLRMMDELAKQ